MQRNTLKILVLGFAIVAHDHARGQVRDAAAPAPASTTGSQLTASEADALLRFHNKARKEAGVAAAQWSPKLATFAQEWANEVARTGELEHRPREGAWQQKYGENMAWGRGQNRRGLAHFAESAEQNVPVPFSAGGFDALAGAQPWYDEMKLYAPGTPIPSDFSTFKAAHYTQMVWKDTTHIGAGKATIAKGEKKGWIVIVCNYNPPGNLAGQKPY